MTVGVGHISFVWVEILSICVGIVICELIIAAARVVDVVIQAWKHAGGVPGSQARLAANSFFRPQLVNISRNDNHPVWRGVRAGDDRRKLVRT